MTRRRLLPHPDDALAEQLVAGEVVLHLDRPALHVFLFVRWKTIALLGASLGVVACAVASGQERWVTVVAFLVADLLLIRLLALRLRDRCARYAVTSLRVLSTTGLLDRRQVSVPLAQVTDVSCRQSVPGRIFGYATVRVGAAHVPTAVLTGLRDPKGFHRALLWTLADRHTDPGATTPFLPVSR